MTIPLYNEEPDPFADTPDAKRAELVYRLIKTHGGRSLIEIVPKTGRPHQIRVAMQSLDAPIVGDKKYGAATKLNGTIALFARSLTFRKPVGGQEITITATPPRLFSL